VGPAIIHYSLIIQPIKKLRKLLDARVKIVMDSSSSSSCSSSSSSSSSSSRAAAVFMRKQTSIDIIAVC
jgi:hypothetical protein